MGIKAEVEPLALWEAVRTGASGRQRTFDRLYDRFLPNTYDPPSFALKLGHKDMRLATELGVPMRLANMAFAAMTEALNRGWENRDSRSPALLQLERCGIKVEVDPRRIQEVFDRDPPHSGRPKRG
jgi:3-hydroxyisobutyrate dehydrogenase